MKKESPKHVETLKQIKTIMNDPSFEVEIGYIRIKKQGVQVMPMLL